MTYTEIGMVLSIFAPLFAALIAGVGIWNKIKKESLTKQETRKKFRHWLIAIINEALIILIVSLTIVIKFPFKDKVSNSTLPSLAESLAEAISDKTEISSINSTDIVSNVTSENYSTTLEYTKTGPVVTQRRVETTRSITETTKTPMQNQVYNHRIPIQKGDKTIRLMDIEGANNFLYYLFDNGDLIFSGAGTCVYPLNKQYKYLNFSLKVVLPIKKNTTNKANLVISGDGKEICTIKFDKDFKQQDKAIDVSNVKTLTFYFEELGYTHITLGAWMETPVLIYK